MTGHDDDRPADRFRHQEIEIAASPEEVWEAIGTAQGHAAWLFPAEFDGREGGDMVIHREPFGADAHATVTAWDPSRRFAFEEPVAGAGASMATEFLVEARGGGSCVVRVVTGFRRDGEGWEDLVEGVSVGWRMALPVLRAYVTHFRGRPAARLDATVYLGRPVAERAEIFDSVMGRLGLAGLAAGDPFRTSADAPPLAGIVEYGSEGYVLLRAAEPHPALFAISIAPMDDPALSVNVLGRFYGDAAPGVAIREKERWNAWLETLPGG